MKLSFFGADRCVTGSCHCIEANGKKILIDCGLQQGRDEVDNASFPFAPGSVDYLLVTHAHIDHSGRIPLLIKQGFRGRILTTRLTGDLMKIMLLDSAHIQEQDAEWKNRKGARAGAEPVEPLYTIADAQTVEQYLTTCEYGQEEELCEGVTVRFVDAGHLLGSACIVMDITENGAKKRIVFSGDLGNVNQPIIQDPTHISGADYVVMESTYGDRNHDAVWSYTDDLAKIIDETMAKGGNVVIPSFAVGRTQELLYFIREIKENHMVKSNPDFPVYIDSPLAREATQIFDGDLRGYLDPEALKLVKRTAPKCSPSQSAHDLQHGGVQGAERGRYSQNHHLRVRHVRRGTYPPSPEAQPVAAGMLRGVRGLSGRGDTGPLPAGRSQVREDVRRGNRGKGENRQLHRLVLPCGPRPSDCVDLRFQGAEAPACLCGAR
jgi:metallo-beta-lactamase family protein